MRTVRYTNRFRGDYRREKSGRHGRRLDAELLETVTMLAKDERLPRRYFDHPLGGEWSDHRVMTKPGEAPVTSNARQPGRRHLIFPTPGYHALLRSRDRAFGQALAIACDLAGRGDP
jgi:mRNA-degrading endonuclease YafQ of YafQ-DinJ toxin-antitoxin module